MKKIAFILVLVLSVSCQKETKNYVTLSGKIIDQNSDSILVRNRNFSKTIKVNKDGTFKDTLKVEAGLYALYDGVESTTAYLKNGFDLNISLDTEMFDETINYSGEGAEHNNFLAEKVRFIENLFDLDELRSLDSIGLEAKFDDLKNEMTTFYSQYNNVDSMLINDGIKSIDRTIGSYKRYLYGELALKRQFPKGTVSPMFENYENFNGEETSLNEFKGKYIYIDVWATWCGPCKAEIPSLKKVEHQYRDKNIAFISISVDDDRRNGSWENAKKKWKDMVIEKELSGVQLFAPQGFQSSFIKEYKISSIPRFILINPEGKIVNVSAPRPSSKELINLFKELNI